MIATLASPAFNCALVDMPAEAREAFVELVKHTARAEAERAKGSR
jgi:hypothetical protein